MANYCIAIFLLLCSILYCNGKVTKNENGTLDFTKSKEVKVTSNLQTEFDGKGLEPWYDLAKSFVHTVQKDDLPYDEFANDFKAEEFLKGWELPFLVVFAIGILFAIIMPIVGLCFCCCRTCGNCGGEMSQKQTNRASLKRALFGIFLGIIVLVMFAGCLMAFVSNDRITDTFHSFKSTPIAALDAANDYFNQTLDLITENVFDNIVGVLGIVLNDVTNLPKKISDEVKSKLENNVKVPLEKVVKLGESTTKMEVLLDKVNNSTVELKSKYKELEKNLSDANKKCPGGDCGLKTDANFTKLPPVTDELDKVAGVLNKSFVKKAEDGLEEFNKIDETIKSRTTDNTQSIQNETNKARDKFINEVQKDVTDKLNEEFFDRTSKWKNDITKYFDDYKVYDDYRYYAGVGITCLILLPVVLMALGLLCGIFGHEKEIEPTERGSMSHMGGNCLMAAVGFMFIFVFILMLLTSFFFIFGAHLEKGCNSVRNDEIFTQYLDVPKFFDNKYILADAFFNNGSIDLTIKSVLDSCRNNAALYTAIRGDKKWDLHDKFNVTKELGDFEKDINDFDANIEDQKILDNATLENLKELRNTGVDKIDFATFFEETNKTIVPDLDQKIIELEKNGSNATAAIKQLQEIKTGVDQMQSLANDLEADVTELQILGGNLSVLANETIAAAKNAQDHFSNNSNAAVKDVASKSAKQILGYIDQTTGHSINIIEKQLGRCEILTDIYDAVVNLLCRDTVYPFNGFWFSLGLCLFFYIPAIILSVKLAKHYRRMKFEEGFDRHNGMEMQDRNAVYPK